MATRDELQALLPRVKAATGADRHADVLLWALDRGLSLEWQGSTLVAGHEGVIGWRDPGEHSDNFYTNRDTHGPGSIPAYTASVDAALALIGRALPGACWRVEKSCEYPGLSFRTHQFTGYCGDWGAPARAEGPTPALALLAALIEAKIAETDND